MPVPREYRFRGRTKPRKQKHPDDEYAAYWMLQEPDPQHVLRLRAGIAEFRQLLERYDKG